MPKKKIKDIIKEIKEHDYTDDNRLWFEGINFTFFNPNGSIAKKEYYEDNEQNDFELNELEVSDYAYALDTSYINFVVVRCSILLKEELL